MSYAEIAISSSPGLPRDAAELTDAHARLLSSILRVEPAMRPSAADVRTSHVLHKPVPHTN